MRKLASGLFATMVGMLAVAEAEGEVAAPEGFVEVDLWAGVPPGTPGGDLPKENTLDPARVSQVNRPRIWLCLPEKKEGARPAACVLLVPGGGMAL